MDKEEKNVEMVHLSPYMKSVIERLTADKKRPAVHTYNATLNSFTKFSGGSVPIIVGTMNNYVNFLFEIKTQPGVLLRPKR